KRLASVCVRRWSASMAASVAVKAERRLRLRRKLSNVDDTTTQHSRAQEIAPVPGTVALPTKVVLAVSENQTAAPFYAKNVVLCTRYGTIATATEGLPPLSPVRLPTRGSDTTSKRLAFFAGSVAHGSLLAAKRASFRLEASKTWDSRALDAAVDSDSARRPRACTAPSSRKSLASMANTWITRANERDSDGSTTTAEQGKAVAVSRCERASSRGRLGDSALSRGGSPNHGGNDGNGGSSGSGCCGGSDGVAVAVPMAPARHAS
ncbi:unnamed protein product, partial [Phaeothamnion confervicola]